MKHQSLLKTALIITAIVSLISFIFINTRPSNPAQAKANNTELAKPLRVQEQEGDEDADKDMPNVALVAHLLKLVGKHLPAIY